MTLKSGNGPTGWLRLSMAALLFAVASPALAVTVGDLDDLKLDLAGSYRFRVGYEGDVPAYHTPPAASREEEQGLDGGWTGDHRIRLEPKLTVFHQLTVTTQLDLLDGNLFADTGDRSFLEFSDLPPPNEVGGDIDGFRVNHAFADWRAPFGVLRFGRQPSHWGLGMIANDGDGYDVAFGDKSKGDASDRILFGTKPLSVVEAVATGQRPDADHDPLTLGLAYDFGVDRGLVVKPGDDVTQYIVALLWDEKGGAEFHERPDHRAAGSPRGASNRVGFYAVRREQEHDDRLIRGGARPPREFLDAWVLDTSGRLVASPTAWDGFEVRFEWEAAFATGETNLTVSRTLQSPSDPFPVSDVEQWGGLVRLVGEGDTGVARLELGVASGDGDRLDDKVKDFRFHPDYNVGLILFEDLMASVTAAQSYNVVHQLGEGGPVPFLGANYLASDGAVTNTIYVNPVVEFDPLERYSVVFGVLWARALERLVDPFNDVFFGGGAGELNSYGGDADRRDLGTEVDLGLHHSIATDLAGAIVEVGLEYGHLFVGDAFSDSEGGTVSDVDKVRVRFTATW